MYQLYYSPGSCSMAIHAMLNEIGAPVELHKLDIMAGDGQKPEFLKLNPRGQVPVLVDDGVVVREGAAIALHLLEKHNSPLMPKSGKERAAALEWLMFANATLHPAYARVFFLMKNAPDKLSENSLFKTALAMINKNWAEVDARLASNAYICGETITAADILITVIAGWGAYFPEAPTLGANVKRLLKAVSDRPAFQKALKEEAVEYKAAA